MFDKDPSLRAAGEQINYTPEMIAEYIKCKEDIIYFAENYFYIQNGDHGKIKIPLWGFQKKMLKSFVDPGPWKNIVTLSARQSGKTTISTVFMTHYILFNKDKLVAILANNEKTARSILERIKYAYKELPLWLQSGIREWNKSSVAFENDVKIFAGSTAGSASRGQSISLLYLDEFAFIPQYVADEFMASVFPTVASSKSSKIIIVSTPNGMNHYFQIWRNAVQGLHDPSKGNSFKPIRINWDEIPDRDETFKEKMIRDMGLAKWNQEFAGKFVGSTNTLVNPELLERCQLLEPIDFKIADNLSVYERPEEGATYIMGVDSAKGNFGDYSVVNVLKISNQYDVSQVAVYRSNAQAPIDFAQICIEISKYYNNCFMMVENNDVGEIVANYIWYDFECDKILNCDPKGIGIRATRKTKLAANLHLKRYMDSGYLTLVDKQTIYELTRYEEVSPDVFHAAGQNENDDCVTSLLWALYFLNTEFYDAKSNDVKINAKNKIDYNDEDAPIGYYEGGDDGGFDDDEWGDLFGKDDPNNVL